MRRGKKGDMTSKMIITIILLVVGFGILLIFLYNFIWEQDIDRTVCHESVIYKATLPDIQNVKEYIPLKCNTRKVCITDKPFWRGKGDCKEEFQGEKYSNVRISSNKDKREQQIKTFIAREMADCWTMMGEGKIQIFKREAVLKKETRRCVICSRISFDKDLQKKLDEEGVTEIEQLADYLMKHKVPNKEISYWEFLSSGLDSTGYSLEKDKISLEQKAIVFIEHDETDAPKWIVGLLGGTGGGVVGAKLGGAIGFAVGGIPGAVTLGFIGFVGGAAVGGLAGRQVGTEIEREIVKGEISQELGENGYGASNYIIDYDVSKLEELDCKSFEDIP